MIGLRHLRRSARAEPIELTDEDRRLVFQAAAVLLDYPDDPTALDLVVTALCDLDATPHRRLLDCAVELAGITQIEREQLYVETFDLRRRCSLHLTYYRDGDTRRRGNSLAEMRDRQRDLGADGDARELPDYLPLLLEVAATITGGDAVLTDHIAALELLRSSLHDIDSPFEAVLGAVVDVLPPLDEQDQTAVAVLARRGPPSEEVGLTVSDVEISPNRKRAGR